jgi:hypothetical protein
MGYNENGRIGTVFVEMDLDKTKFEAKQQKLKDDVQKLATDVERSLQHAMQNLGVQSDTIYQLMANKAIASYKRISDAANASASEQIRAKQSMIAQINALNTQLAKSPAFEGIGIRSSTAIAEEMKQTFAWYAMAKQMAQGNANEIARIEAAKTAKIIALENELGSVRIANEAKWNATAKANAAERIATAKGEVDAKRAMQEKWATDEMAIRQRTDAARRKTQDEQAAWWMASGKYSKDANTKIVADAEEHYKTLGIRSQAAIQAQIADVGRAATAQQAIVTKGSQDWINIERAKNAKLKELNAEMVGSHEMSMAGMTRNLLRFYAAWYVISAAVGAIGRQFMSGVEAIDKLQLSAVTVAATITNLQGTTGNVAENYKNNLIYAKALVPVLMQIDAASLANLEQVNLINNALAMHGVILDGSNKKQVASMTALTNTIAIFTRGQSQEQQASQETQALMRGEVTTRNRVALMIDQQIRRQGDYVDGLKGLNAEAAKHGDWLERIQPYLVGINAATGDISKTWEAVRTSLQTTWMILQTEIFADFYKGLVTGGQEAVGWARENASEIGKYFRITMNTVSDTFQGALGILKGFIPVMQDIAPLIAMIAYGWGGVSATIKPIGEFLGNTIALIYRMGQALVQATMAGAAALTGNKALMDAYWAEAKKNFAEVEKLAARNKYLMTDGIVDAVAEYDKLYEARKKAEGGGTVPKVPPPGPTKEELDAAKKAAEALAKLLEHMRATIEGFSVDGLDGTRKQFEQNRLEAEKLRKEFEKLPPAQKEIMYAEIAASQARKDALVVNNMVQKSREENAKAMKVEADAMKVVADAAENALKSYEKIEARHEDLAMTSHQRAINRINAVLSAEIAAIEKAVALDVKSRTEANILINKLTTMAVQQRFEQENANEKHIYDMKLRYLKDMGQEYSKEYRDISILKIKNEADKLEREFQNAAGGGGQTQAQQEQLKAEQELTLKLLTEWEERLRAYAAYLTGMGDTAGASKALSAAEEMAKKKIELQDRVAQNAVKNQQTMFDKAAWTNKKIQELDMGTAKGFLGNIDNMLSAAQSMYDKESSEYKRLAEWKKGIQIAQLAMDAAASAQLIASNIAKMTSNAALSVSNAGTAVTGAAISVGPLGFVTAAAMIALMASVFAMYGIAGGGGSSAGTSYKASTGYAATTVLGGEAGASSESVTDVTTLLADIHAEEYSELQAIYRELQELNTNITGLTGSILKTAGFALTGIGVDLTEQLSGGRQVWNNIGITGMANVAKQSGDFYKIIAPFEDTLNSFFGQAGEWLFGGSTNREISGGGISLSPTTISALNSGKSVEGQQYITVKSTTSGGVFGKDKVSLSTTYAPLEEEATRLITQVYKNLGNTAVELAKIFGMDVGAALNYMFPAVTIDLFGLTGEEINKKLAAWISETGDVMAKNLFGDIVAKYQLVGEGMYETAIRVATGMVVVRESLAMIGLEMEGTTVQLIEWTQAMIDGAGGLDKFQEQVSLYYEKFFNDAERNATQLIMLNKALSEFGLSLPGTREEFRKIVESIDISTESGMKLFLMLMDLVGMANDYYSYSEEVTRNYTEMQIELMEMLGDSSEALAAKRRLELEAMDESLWALQEAIWSVSDAQGALSAAEEKLRESFDVERKLIEDVISGLQSAISKLISARESLKMEGFAAEIQRSISAQLAFNVVLSQARLGDFSGMESMGTSLSNLVSAANSTNMFATKQEYEENFYKTYNTLKELESLTGEQLTFEEKNLKALDDQLNALLGINNSILSLTAAIANYINAKEAFAQASANARAVASAPWTPPGSSYTEPGTPVAPAPPASAPPASTTPTTPTVSPEEYVAEYTKYIQHLEAYPEDVPVYPNSYMTISGWIDNYQRTGSLGYAQGGYHEGGWRMVGEQGPELEYTGASRIFSNKDSKALIDNSELVNEVKALRVDLNAIGYAVAKSVGKSAKITDRWDIDGLPPERT